MCIGFMYGSVWLRLQKLDHPTTLGISGIGCDTASAGVHQVKPCWCLALCDGPSIAEPTGNKSSGNSLRERESQAASRGSEESVAVRLPGQRAKMGVPTEGPLAQRLRLLFRKWATEKGWENLSLRRGP